MQRCWDQEPRSRPGIREVLQDLVSSLLWSLYQFTKFSPKFQVALSQFYDSTEHKGCVNHLDGAELKEFVNFLDEVRRLLDFSHLNPGFNIFFRSYVPRD